jgi:hypothetical protein
MAIGDSPPASPVVGQTWWQSSSGNSFVYYDDGNSLQWVPSHVGVLPASGTATTTTVEPFEQVFQLGGLDYVDVTVPAWAEGVKIDVCAYLTAFTWVVARVSFDGTTFKGGGTDYKIVGGVHASGSDGWTSTALSDGNGMWLSGSSDSPQFPQNITAELNLKRPSTAHLFHAKSYARTFTTSNPARQYRGHWFSSWPLAALDAGLAIKALRIATVSPGQPFDAGSWVRLSWIGNIPISVGLPEAPLDGQAYERKSGAWAAPDDEVIGGTITIGNTAPASPVVNQVWIDTT